MTRVGRFACAVSLVLASSASAQPQVEFPGQYAPSPGEWKYGVWPRSCAGYDEAERRIACLEWNVFDYGRLARFRAANAALEPPRAGERRVVFFGDSITDNWSKPGYGGFFPGKRYVNRGIGGQTTAQMLLRFRRDVVALQPKAVVILAGTNDIAGNAGPTTLEEIEDNLASMADLAKAHAIKVILATVLPVADDKPNPPLVQTRIRPPAKIAALNRWIAEYAKANGHVVLDYFAAVADASGLFKPELNDDGLHPNAAGYAVMAPLADAAIARAIRK